MNDPMPLYPIRAKTVEEVEQYHLELAAWTARNQPVQPELPLTHVP